MPENGINSKTLSNDDFRYVHTKSRYSDWAASSDQSPDRSPSKRCPRRYSRPKSSQSAGQNLPGRAPRFAGSFYGCQLEGPIYKPFSAAGRSSLKLTKGRRHFRLCADLDNSDSEAGLYSRVAKKALEVNLNPLWYGVLAEIGAGQETSRWFFRVGAAAGTIAKSVSAYDMTMSDTVYGAAERYVTQERLKAMLDYEFLQVNLTLRKQRGKETAFFAFADTVTAKAFNRDNECHGWLGIKYQDHPQQDPPNEILIHIRMLDDTAQKQQLAVGSLGVNLIHGALTCKGDPNKVIEGLLDDLSRWRITVDLIDFSGPAFTNVDNRVAALRLVQKELCDAALFDPSGKLLIPQEQLYKKNVLLVRGRFRPFTLLHNDMLMGAAQQFFCGPDEASIQEFEEGTADRSAVYDECVYRDDSCVILELTTRSMMEGGDLLDWTSNSGIQEGAFIQTIEALSTLGYIVMVSNQGRYFRLASYLAAFTQKSIVIAMGIPALKELFREKFYMDLQGGILEGFGRLLKHDLKIYVYPTLIDGKLVTAENLKVDPQVQKLYDYIFERGTIIPIKEYDTNLLKTGDVSKYVQQSIHAGTDEWEGLVPVHVRDQIKSLNLLGYSSTLKRNSGNGKEHGKADGNGKEHGKADDNGTGHLAKESSQRTAAAA